MKIKRSRLKQLIKEEIKKQSKQRSMMNEIFGYGGKPSVKRGRNMFHDKGITAPALVQMFSDANIDPHVASVIMLRIRNGMEDRLWDNDDWQALLAWWTHDSPRSYADRPPSGTMGTSNESQRRLHTWLAEWMKSQENG